MHIFFDLDGTLTDPGVGITRCIQHAMERLGRPIPSPESLSRFVGPPLAESFAELLETTEPSIVNQAIAHYRERYVDAGMFEAVLYAGVAESLGRMKAAGHELFVVTAKPRVFAEQVVSHFGVLSFFDGLYGSELDGRNTDKVDLIRLVLEVEGMPASDTWMVGDRGTDISGAEANGISSVAAGWGYGSPEELLAARPTRHAASMSEVCLLFGA